MKFSKEYDLVVEEMKNVTKDLNATRKDLMSGALASKEAEVVHNNAGKTIAAQKTILETFKMRIDQVRVCFAVKTFLANNPKEDIDPDIKLIAGV